MTAQAIKATGELSASSLNWKRLRRLAVNCGLLICAVSGTVFYMNGGVAGVLLRADGHVLRERVTVAPAFEGRVAQVFVRPGDHVEKGQKIAVVKSVAITRTLADLAAEKARLMSKIAELQARRQVIIDTLPLAKSSAAETASYLNSLNQARTAGLAINKSLQEMTSASLLATEHVASLRAEQDSLSAELDANRIALSQAASAYDELSATYADGVLYALASGDIGASVAPVGQGLSTGNGGVADIFTGESFVLAYVPDAYIFDILEGQTVGVRARNEVLNGRIDRILPLAEALPSELQMPNRMLERGRLVRIALVDFNQLPVDQRVQVTTCFLADCHAGVLHAALEQTHTALARLFEAATSIGSEAKELVQRIERAYGELANHSSRVSST
jgi:multidrug efflux pump subunit AcrA (membrane-fusion protein)